VGCILESDRLTSFSSLRALYCSVFLFWLGFLTLVLQTAFELHLLTVCKEGIGIEKNKKERDPFFFPTCLLTLIHEIKG
jgi:hypothetical protein